MATRRTRSRVDRPVAKGPESDHGGWHTRCRRRHARPGHLPLAARRGEWTGEKRDRVIDEVGLAFRFNTELFDDLGGRVIALASADEVPIHPTAEFGEQAGRDRG